MDKMDGINSRMSDTYTRLVNNLIAGASADCFHYAWRIQELKLNLKRKGMPYHYKLAVDKRIAFHEDIIMTRAKNLMEHLEMLPVQVKIDPYCIEQRGTRENLISLGVIKPSR